jgi:excisionase family DNA binding protein
MSDRLLTVEELAERLRVPVKTVYAWRYKHQGPPGISVGRHIRFRPEAVEAWLRQREDERANR